MPSYKQEGTQPVPIQPGKHKIEIEFAETKISPKSHNEYIRLKCRAKMNDGSNGSIIYDNMPFAPGMEWKVDQMRESMGFAIIPGEEADVEPQDLIGRSATVIVRLDDETGYHKIDRWISPKEAVKPKSKDGDEIPF